jgi:hypothetical protein
MTIIPDTTQGNRWDARGGMSEKAGKAKNSGQQVAQGIKDTLKESGVLKDENGNAIGYDEFLISQVQGLLDGKDEKKSAGLGVDVKGV